MPLNIIRNDISKVSADAIVNSANPEVAIGEGVDSTIYEAAGAEKLFAEREKIGKMKPGQAAVTPAFDLDAKYIIHTVGPVWHGGNHGEPELLSNCYYNSLIQAKRNGIRSIAFPAISTGVYGYPIREAAKRAIRAVVHTLDADPDNFDRVVFVMFSERDREVYEAVRDEYYSNFSYLWE